MVGYNGFMNENPPRETGSENSDRKETAKTEIAFILQETRRQSANGSEPDEIMAIAAQLERDELSPEDAVGKAQAVFDRKNETF